MTPPTRWRRSRTRSSSLLPKCFRLPLVILATAGDDHRQPGGDFGRVFGDPAGDPARLHPAPQDHPHQRACRRADLYPGDQLGADDHGHRAGVVLPLLVQPCRGLWHRGYRRDADRRRADRRRAVQPVEVDR